MVNAFSRPCNVRFLKDANQNQLKEITKQRLSWLFCVTTITELTFL